MKLVLLLAFTAYFLPSSDGHPNPHETMTVEDRGMLLKRCPIHNGNHKFIQNQYLPPKVKSFKYSFECIFSYNSKFTDNPIIRDGAECMSSDKALSYDADTFECRKLCEEEPKCYFYIVGKEGTPVEGRCYWEKTEIPKTLDQNKICSEGWENDNYIFYQALSMSITLKSY